MIDELSKTMTTGQIIARYRRLPYGMVQLDHDIKTCSKGNRLAIEDALGRNVETYHQGEFLEITNEDELVREMM